MREWIGIFEGQGTVVAALFSLLGVCIGAGSMMVYEKSRFLRSVFDDMRFKRLEAHQRVLTAFRELFEKLLTGFYQNDHDAILEAYNELFPVYLRVVTDNEIWMDEVALSLLMQFTKTVHKSMQIIGSRGGFSQEEAKEIWIRCQAAGDRFTEVCRQQAGMGFLDKRMKPFTKRRKRTKRVIEKRIDEENRRYRADVSARIEADDLQ